MTKEADVTLNTRDIDVRNKLTVKVTVIDPPDQRFKRWIGMQIMRLGVWVYGAGFEIVE